MYSPYCLIHWKTLTEKMGLEGTLNGFKTHSYHHIKIQRLIIRCHTYIVSILEHLPTCLTPYSNVPLRLMMSPNFSVR